MKRFYLLLTLLALVLLAFIFKVHVWAVISPHEKTISQRLHQFGDTARARWKPYFSDAKINYPPAKVVFLAVKDERQLQIYAAEKSGDLHWIRNCPILAGSSYPGPKLMEGDGQVPEGVYPVESLNPNSICHVALRLGYPNEFDVLEATKDGRTHLGGDIMIHGGEASVGCLAMGDEVAEDMFVLVADSGLTNFTVIITPVDFRKGKAVSAAVKLPDWADTLYSQIKTQLAALPLADSK